MHQPVLKTALAVCICAALSCNISNPKEEKALPDEMALHIDSTVKPGDDFFDFANGRWFKQNPIPASEAYNGLWKTIQDTINASILHICENAAVAKGDPGSLKQKIGDFYFSGMDTVTVGGEGLNALKDEFARIDAAATQDDLLKAAARVHIISGNPLFNFYVAQDDKISSKYAIFIMQGGLGLPDRDYYFDSDSRTQSLRKQYVQHLENMFVLMGKSTADAKKASAEVMKLETALAASSRKMEALRDPHKNYNKMNVAALQQSVPGLNWKAFFEAAGLSAADSVIVGQPEYLASLNREWKNTPVSAWKDYLRFHLVKGLARFLDDKTYAESFSFYSTALRGIKEPRPRWKRVVEDTDRLLGELIGQVYVNEYLPKGTKEKLMEIGQAIKDEYAQRIRNLDWMSEATKTKALNKLNTMMFKVGYPDHWKDMSAMKIDKQVFVKNVISANEWHWNYMTSKIGKPVDRTEWDMQPQTYNAYYNPSNNEIVVPGCNITVPGYEGRLADDAILYSIIGGSTFGHEITHGFDDQGCQYDELGNLNNWWTTEDSTKFFAKTKMIVEQYSNYVVVDSLHINGDATQGENIADLGGVMMGYEAFKKTKQYKENISIAGLTPDQRYFLGYAMAWMINMRPESLANQVKTDVHSPAKFRVIGPLSNMPEFFAAFQVSESDKMWRPDSLRIKIW